MLLSEYSAPFLPPGANNTRPRHTLSKRPVETRGQIFAVRRAYRTTRDVPHVISDVRRDQWPALLARTFPSLRNASRQPRLKGQKTLQQPARRKAVDFHDLGVLAEPRFQPQTDHRT
eukprot:687356-Prorocentrum_minimum.AAC.3